MTNKSFRYLKLFRGYQRGSIFSGFTQPGFWVANSPNPTSYDVPVGTSKQIEITVTRQAFDKDIDLSLYQVPDGITGTFNPPTLTGTQNTSILTLNVSGGFPPVNGLVIVISGTPLPQQVAQFTLNVLAEPYYAYGAPIFSNLRSAEV